MKPGGKLMATGTPFIDFFAYPFIKFFGCSYLMMMVLFVYMGYWGFVLFYIFFKENIDYHYYIFGISLITIIIFLPNMHYWTVSLGKGFVIFLGIGMVMYGLSKLKARMFSVILGLVIVYHVVRMCFFFWQ